MSNYDKAQVEALFRHAESSIYHLAGKLEEIKKIVSVNDDAANRVSNMMWDLGNVNGILQQLWYDHRESATAPNPEWDPVHGR